MKYNKLVRDKIPEIIKQKGGNPITHIADDAEYEKKLHEKLLEEVQEFLKAKNKEELADVLEVIEAVCDNQGFNPDELAEIKNKKAEERGKFKKRIILEES